MQLAVPEKKSRVPVRPTAYGSRTTGTKRSPFVLCLAFLILLTMIGIASAATPADTSATNVTTVPTTIGTTITTSVTTAHATISEKTGGSIYFDSIPIDATIWLDDVKMGTTPFTYYSEENDEFKVVIRKKGYEDFSGTVLVREGKRVVFTARLTPLPSDLSRPVTITAATVTPATTQRVSTMKIPTPWPTSTPKSPVDPVTIIGAAVTGGLLFVLRRH